jgi:hypothetical protein
MKAAAIVTTFLMLSATSAMAEGADCTAEYSASLKRQQTTASVERPANEATAATAVAQDNSHVSTPATVSQ